MDIIDTINLVEVASLATEWDKAREKVCSLSFSDAGYRDALDKLSEAEDLMSKRLRKLRMGEE